MAFEFESNGNNQCDSDYISVTRKTINGALSHNFTPGRSVDDQIHVDNENTVEVKIFREDYTVEPRHDLGFYIISLNNTNPNPDVKMEISLQLSINNLEVSLQQFINNQQVVE